jgi:hypothetical protein
VTRVVDHNAGVRQAARLRKKASGKRVTRGARSPVPRSDGARHLAVRAGFIGALRADERFDEICALYRDRIDAVADEKNGEKLVRPILDDLTARLDAYVRDELGLRWPWCCDDLFAAFMCGRFDMPRHLSGSRGRRRKDDTAHLARSGRWLYEHRVRQPKRSLRALARDHHREDKHPYAFEACECVKRLGQGIRDAERLLGL